MAVAKPKKKSGLKFFKQNLLPVILSVLLLTLIVITYQVVAADKYLPLTFVGDTNISFLTQGQAIRKVESSFRKRTQQRLSLSAAQDSFTIDIATASAALDYSALTSAFKESRQGALISRIGR
ncbi:MAG: hypothetical protein Q8Q86_01975, partial [Candidatus Daviesbacteria bacterium]|nr:hypothetical protein [Candidatus Daviesbacteria bacterium]